MKNSIMQKGKFCYVCYKLYPLHKHHVYGGRNRSVSEDNGFWVWLCPDHHTGDHGVHRLHHADLFLKRTCQSIYEKDHTHEDFMELVGKNYLGVADVESDS